MMKDDDFDIKCPKTITNLLRDRAPIAIFLFVITNGYLPIIKRICHVMGEYV